jgi:16S rRNA (cytosine1402-N4)-methyltransferase
MVAEVLELLEAVPAGVVVDATVGGGGHAAALLERRSDVVVLGIDRDAEAVAESSRRLAAYGGRAVVCRASFDDLRSLLTSALPTDLAREGVAAVLFDLGVSSHQLDDPGRGFSFRNEGPLDMRMDQSSNATAGDLVNSADEGELERLFVANGEERFGRRIARAIVKARPLSSTAELASVVAGAVPAAARRKGHPARRVFQALRVEVNDELEVLARALDESLELLAPHGRIIAIAYHSGEDRIVKQRFRDWSSPVCNCPPGLPCVCGKRARVLRLTRRAMRPTPEEISANPRAREARLRAVERLGVDDEKAS